MNLPCKILFLCLIFCFNESCRSEEDLYRILGVSKTATGPEIKKAYKKLAREFHPDKNKEPNANEKFMKINEAYTTLSDDEKRVDYDNFGTTSAKHSFPQGQGRQHHGFHGFDEFFGHNPFRNFHFRRDSGPEKHRVTYRKYVTKVVPDSKRRPYVFYAYSDFCFSCMRLEPLWEKLVSDMNTIGLGVGTLHIQVDANLAHKIKIHHAPTIFGVIDGRVTYFKGDVSLQLLRDFVRGFYPRNLITEVTNNNYKDFLDGWNDNHVRVLFYANRKQCTLRILAAAYAYRENIKVGYVNLNSPNAAVVQKKFNVRENRETMIMFNEEVSTPIATLTMQQISRSTIDEMMEANKYLTLPRLSCQLHFNQLCPVEVSSRRKKLCVVLLTKNIESHEQFRASFRKFSQQVDYESDRVRFTYIYEDAQGHFVTVLTRGVSMANESSLPVALLWRRGSDRVSFDWLQDGWSVSGDAAGVSVRRLKAAISYSLDSKDVLQYDAKSLPDLLDEHAQGLFIRIVTRIGDWWNAIYDRLSEWDELTILTLTFTVFFVVVIGMLMQYLVTMEDQQIRSKQRKMHHREVQDKYRDIGTVYLQELRVETFSDLVTKTEPGYRTIVLLVDEDNKARLLQRYAEVVQPYCRSSAFSFSFLQLEQYLWWYRQLLEETLEFRRALPEINLKNCIGTVISINGYRKYFSMYHPWHEVLKKSSKKSSKGAEFMGMEDSESEENSDDDGIRGPVFVDNLLDGLPHWFDRLVEGSLKRLRIDSWPQMSE